jgi:hypothetical protein
VGQNVFADAAQVPLLAEEALYPIRIRAGESLHLEPPNNVLSAGTLALILKQSNSAQKIEISGAEIQGVLDLQRAEIPAEIVLQECIFRGPVILDHSWFHHALGCKNCVFNDVVSANFAKIESDLDLEGSRFLLAASFKGMQISDDLILQATHFQGSQAFELSKTVVGSDLDATQATFDTRVDWNHLQVKGQLKLTGARFTDADFESLQVGEDLIATMLAGFSGELHMEYVDARGIYFPNCSFEKGVYVSRATIHRHLSFQNSILLGGLNASESQIANDLDLRRALIQVRTSADHRISPSLDLDRSKVGGIARLNQAYIEGVISLAGSELEILSVAALQHLPSDRGAVRLTRATVHEFETQGNVEKTAKTVREFLEQADYDPGIYNQFDSFLRAQGDYDDADNVFVHSQSRNRDERLNHDWVANLRSWLWFVFSGYGHLAWLSLIWSSAVVLVGTIVFWKRSNMALREEKLQNLDYNPFWFSLDVFAPIIDLEAARIWQPRPEKHWLWNYLRIQRILGWILVPLALVAITGALQFTG